jgi:PhnB protein
MSNIRLEPYLFFQGDCREAMEFYKSVFGGELTMQTMGEVPGDMPGKEERKDEIMHAKLSGGMATFMASDSTQASPSAAKIELSLNGSGEDALRTAFDKLANGGNVRTPLERMFWGDVFGALTDKYGIDWMVNIESAQS